MMSCNRHYGIQGYADCSGNGRCVDGLCVCNTDWSYIGDWDLIEGYDCDIYLPSIKYLAITYIIISFPALIIQLYVAFIVFKKRKLKATYTQMSVLAMLLANICGYIHCSMKLYDPIKFVVYGSLATSANTTVMVIGEFGSTVYLCLQIVEFLQGYLKMSNTQRENFHSFISTWKFIFILNSTCMTLTATILCVVGIYHWRHKYSETISLITDIIILELNIVLLAFIIQIRKKFVSVIQTSNPTILHSNHQQVDVNKIIGDSNKKFDAIFSIFGFNIVFLLVDSCWYFLRRKFSYYIIIQLIIVNLNFMYQTAEFIKSLHTDESIKTSSTILQKNLLPFNKKTMKVTPVSVLPSSNELHVSAVNLQSGKTAVCDNSNTVYNLKDYGLLEMSP